MEQLNNDLPEQEERKPAAKTALQNEKESLLLIQVRQKFGLYGGISLTFGGVFALLFYKAWIGWNVLLYSAVIVGLLLTVMTKLTPKIKIGTKLYFAGVLLLGLSSMLTSNSSLLFLNIIGILILLDLSLLHQFYDVSRWDFATHLGKMFGMVFYSIACLGMPFVDSVHYFKKTKVLKNDLLRNIVIGVVIAIPILFITTALLSNADLLFGQLANEIFDTIFSADLFWIGGMLVFGMLACYCILCAAVSKVGIENKKVLAKADASIAATIMTLLCIVYAYFCILQVLYLFTSGFFVLPDGYSFAEYARRGFFELMWVTGINIGLMILCRTLFKESRFLSILIVFMTVCTYIMIASATYRMILYISIYHLTFLRLFVLLTLFIEIFVLAGVILSEYNKKFPLFSYSVIVVSVCYIVFSLAKPDVWIASYLIDQNETLNQEDMNYLTRELSLDAAPVVLPVLQDEKRWAIVSEKNSEKSYDQGYETNFGTKDEMIKEYYDTINQANKGNHIRDFNYSNYHAGQVAKKYPKLDFK
jgi:hypothetical protein